MSLNFLVPTLGLVSTLLLILVMRPAAIKLGLLDLPGGRKRHHDEIPLIGGLGMFVGVCFALLFLNRSLLEYRSFIAASFILVFVGLLDDFYQLSAKVRFIAQIVAGLIMCLWGGLELHHLGNIFFLGDFNLGVFAIPVSVFGVIIVVNAINMLDGVDGLAGGLAFVSLVFMSLIAFLSGHSFSFQILMILLAALIGFLFFNLRILGRKTAVVFMGDTGSMFLGFVIVWFSIKLSQPPHQAATPVTFLWLMAVPLYDLLAVVMRRLKHKKSPFGADRSHLHHVLGDLGFSCNQIVGTILSFAVVMSAIGVVANYSHLSESMMFVGFVVMLVAYLVVISKLWNKVRKGSVHEPS